MINTSDLRRFYKMNFSCGAEEARNLAEAAAAELEQVRAFFVQGDNLFST